MAYDEEVANRVRESMAAADVIADERRMFGGLAFMVAGHMTVGVLGDELMVRVGKESYDDALALPHARPMDLTSRPMTGFVYVAPPGFAGDGDLRGWVDRALAYAATLPPKQRAGRDLSGPTGSTTAPTPRTPPRRPST